MLEEGAADGAVEDGRVTEPVLDCDRVADDIDIDVRVDVLVVVGAEPTVEVDIEFGGGLATVDGMGSVDVKEATGDAKDPVIELMLIAEEVSPNVLVGAVYCDLPEVR